MYRTTSDYIVLIQQKYGMISRYKVAQLLEKTDTQVANWAKGKTTFDEETASIVAEKLQIDPAIIVTSCQIERAEKQGKTEAAAIYKKILQTLEKCSTTGIAAAVTFSVLGNLYPF